MYICSKCGKEFENVRAYAGHHASHDKPRSKRRSKAEIETEKEEQRLKTEHRASRRQEREKTNKMSHVCRFCGKEFIKGQTLGAHIISCILNPSRKIWIKSVSNSKSGVPLSDKCKASISSAMKIAHKEGRAWNIGQSRWNNEQSYPEKFFEKVINNEFIDKNYVTEYPMGKYALDFAWPDKKLAIEIDGDQHQRFEEYIERDKRKDQFALDNDWQILRISWKDMFNDTKNKISEAYSFIHSGSSVG